MTTAELLATTAGWAGVALTVMAAVAGLVALYFSADTGIAISRRYAAAAGWTAEVLTALAAVSGVIAFYFSAEASAEKDRRVARAEAEVRAVQERFKPRAVSNEAFAKLVAALKGIPIRGPVIVGGANGDAEAMALASRFQQAFTDAGWAVDDATNYIGMTERGQWIAAAGPGVPLHFPLVVGAFKEAGVEIGTIKAEFVSPEAIAVIVGLKPIPTESH